MTSAVVEGGRAAASAEPQPGFLAATALVSPLALAAYAGGLAYALACLHSMYLAGLFGFHDLGLTNDYLANTVRHGRLFYAADLDRNHLGVHFTPTLLLIIPFYALVESQFVLLAVGTLALYGALPFFVRIFAFLTPAPFAPGGIVRQLFPACLLVLLGMNVYTRTVLAAAHFEVLYLLAAGATLYAVLAGAGLVRVLPLALLAAGVREDAGIHLVLQLLAALALARAAPADARPRMRRTVGVACAVVAAYVALVVFVVLPAFGSAHRGYIVQFWGNFGSSPGAIVLGILGSPLRVLREVADSGFRDLNAAFGWLALLDPVVFVLTNLSGLIFYVSAEDAKKHLWYYNAAFLLPGVFLGLAAGLARVTRLVERLARARGRSAGAAAGVVALALVAALAARALASLPATIGGQLEFRRHAPADVGFLVAAMARHLAPCPEARRVAIDFGNVVFVPNRYEKVMLARFASADTVFLVRGASLTLRRLGMLDDALDATIRADGGFEVVQQDARLSVYRRKGLQCGPR